MVKKPRVKGPFEDVTVWVGSTQSFMLHTVAFVAAFFLVLFGSIELDTMLLVLTTAVSLEAIYLAIFIQMSVNQNRTSLREVEEDIDEIEEELEDLTEDDKEEEEREKQQSEALDKLTDEVHRLLTLVETLKRK